MKKEPEMEEDLIATSQRRALECLQKIRSAEQGGDSEIQTSFKGSVVFITGGTGFVGKQLLEKLLRSCQGIKKVYMLMRSKKDKTIAERLDNQWKDPVYDLLRSIDPHFSKRVFPIQGDVTELKLGINDAVWGRVKNEINYIFHIAATVKFNEPLKKAVLINVRGTKELLNLANTVPDLKAFVHVSSCYANCNRSGDVDEVFYPTPIRPETLIDMVESMDDAKFEAIGELITEGWPNTYTFSKAVAENLVKRARNLPICVVRPSIITPTFHEPAMGWLDLSTIYGPSGIIFGVGLGVIHSLYASLEGDFDIVPLDFVNNLTITAAWDTANRGASEKEVLIYTCSRKRNKVSRAQLYNFMFEPARQLVSPKTLWYCFAFITTYKWLFLLYTLILHIVPALMVDTVLKCAGHKPRATKAYWKAYTMNYYLGHFLTNNWDFNDGNTVEVQKKMSSLDKDIFPFDVTSIGVNDYMTIWCLGIRKFILKDSIKGTKAAMKRQKWLKVGNYVFMVLYGLGMWYVLKGLFHIFYFLGNTVSAFL